MDLVEKRAQEMGLCEDFVNNSGRIVGEQDRQRRRGGVKVYPRASSEDEFFFFSSDTSRLELSGVFQIAIPLFVRSLLLFISLFCSSSSYTCQSSMHAYPQVHVPSAILSGAL